MAAAPKRSAPLYSVIVPAYNEQEVLGVCHAELRGVMDATGKPYEIIFVDDGSTDRTPDIIATLARHDRRVRAIGLSRNFGHQIAITAGLDFARGQAVIVIDADLQDPPSVIPQLIARWEQGWEVVYGRRTRRESESVFKRASAWLFYRCLRFLAGVPIPADAGDFRLIDRKVCEALKAMPERHRYVRGLVSWSGFRQCEVPYERRPRRAGTTKYPLLKMIAFAVDAVTSFSHKPLRAAIFLGLAASAGGFAYLLYSIIRYAAGLAVAGWTSLVALLIIFNGILFLVIGIMGEYLGRIYDEVKARPLYIVGRTIGIENETSGSARKKSR